MPTNVRSFTRREDDPERCESPLEKLGIRFCMPNFTAVDDQALFVNAIDSDGDRDSATTFRRMYSCSRTESLSI